jgi:hypothetical protein
MKSQAKYDIANPILYRLYFGFMMNDLCRQLEIEPTPYTKERLHDIHKKHLNYPTTAGVSHDRMSKFLFEVGALWACFGIFVRTKEEQPLDLLDKPLSECWEWL